MTKKEVLMGVITFILPIAVIIAISMSLMPVIIDSMNNQMNDYCKYINATVINTTCQSFLGGNVSCQKCYYQNGTEVVMNLESSAYTSYLMGPCCPGGSYCTDTYYDRKTNECVFTLTNSRCIPDVPCNDTPCELAPLSSYCH